MNSVPGLALLEHAVLAGEHLLDVGGVRHHGGDDVGVGDRLGDVTRRGRRPRRARRPSARLRL